MASSETFKTRNFGFDMKGGGCAHARVCVCVCVCVCVYVCEHFEIHDESSLVNLTFLGLTAMWLGHYF